MNVHSEQQQIIDQIAFSIQHLSPEGRQRHLNDAYAHALAKHPDVTDLSPDLVNFIAAIYRRLAELDAHPAGTA